MTIRKILQSVCALGLIGIFAGHANANLLTNASFETPDASGGDVYGSPDWTVFNNVFTNNFNWQPGGGFTGPVAHTGEQTLKMFDTDGQTSFAFQSVPVTAGQTYQLSAWVINWAGDPFLNLGLMGLTFWDGADGSAGGANNMLGPAYDVYVESTPDPVFMPSSVYLPEAFSGEFGDGWIQLTVQGIAPAGAVSASAFFQTICVPGSPSCSGALYWDSASLELVPVPAAVWLFGSALGLLGWLKRRPA